MSEMNANESLEGIAVVGMSGRFAGAKTLDQFWANLCDGVESVTPFSDEELKAAGVSASVLRSPNYVKSNTVLEGVELFDAEFFGMSPREAEIMDPQHRLFLTCAWEALEHAGYDVENYDGLVGVYGGMGMGYYLLRNLMSNMERVNSEGALPVRISNDKDFLVSQVSYKLDLRGPSVTVQTACSTSLVATHLAAQSLLNYQCDMALAGGVALNLPQGVGYFARDGVFSSDGHCRTFDAKAQGTFGGSGVGILLLKRLSDAIADGDTIHAVIKGSAINNDGAVKVGYTAPNVNGQSEVIALAQMIAGVEPDTITYIEAHGTATPMGDPAEIAALSQVFRASTQRKNFCAIGSVKTNIGHLDAAAGVASLMKTILSLKHRMIPPSLHFEEPNPEIDFATSPFFVNTKLREWESPESPRRAGVSSFAVGGVNAHVVVEEAPPSVTSEVAPPWQLLVLSTKTAAALETATDNLCAHLEQHPDENFADVAYTLQAGRKGFNHRRMVVARDLRDGLAALRARDPKRLRTGVKRNDDPAVTFMFSGLGNHYAGMAEELYRTEPTFRQHVEQCCETLRGIMGFDLREILFPNEGQNVDASGGDGTATRQGLDLRKMLRPETRQGEPLDETRNVHPAMFVIEYALARTWEAWGVSPRAMIGYSLGEYVAACIAGVFSVEDALRLVAQRAELIQRLPRGAMLAVPLSETEVLPLLGRELSLAAVNGHAMSVIAGTEEEIARVEGQLTARGLVCRRLQTSHAFHSKMMLPAFDDFEKLFASIELHPPQVPFVSNVTGTWITPEQATSPRYWAEHMCRTVRFAEGLEELRKQPNRILLEIGPGQALCAWALQHLAGGGGREVLALPSLRHSFENYSDREFLLSTAGKLWVAGIALNWAETHGVPRRRIPLPTYPFETRRYWIEEQTRAASLPTVETPTDKEEDLADWFYVPVWKRSPPHLSVQGGATPERKGCWLVFVDECGVGARIARQLAREQHDVFTVTRGSGFKRLDESHFAISPNAEADYDSLLDELRSAGKLPDRIVHAWCVSALHSHTVETNAEAQALSFDSLLLLAQALGNKARGAATHLDIISNNLHDVTGEEDLQPLKALLLGPCHVIPREYPHVSCRNIDIVLPTQGSPREEQFFAQLFAELHAEAAVPIVAHRGSHRWLPDYEPMRFDEMLKANNRLRAGGVYLITGGVGGIGLTLAERLTQTVAAKLVLTCRSDFPTREQYDAWLAAHPAENEVSRRIRKILELERLGAEVLVMSADVTDRDAMLKVLRRTEEVFGRINGVIHAAGVSPGGLIQVKSLEAASNVLAPKVRGALLLDEIFRGQELDFVVYCSSLLALGGSPGMVDHCAANAFLDAFAHERSRNGRLFTLSLNWDAWLEVGQAANARLSNSLQEILHATPPAEREHPLLDHKLDENHGRETYVSLMSAQDKWALDEHRVMGHAVLPGTAYIEMARAAFAKHADGQPIVIENMVFSAPLHVKDGQRKEVHTVIEKQGDDFSFAVLENVAAGNGRDAVWQQRAGGKIGVGASSPRPRHDMRGILERFSQVVHGGEARRKNGDESNESGARGGKLVEFGARWRKLVTRFHLGSGEGLAYVELPEEFESDLESFQLHPALLDAATGFIQGDSEGAFLPLAYKRLTIRQPLPRKIFSYARYVDDDLLSRKETIACDIIVMDEDGNELVEIEEYVVKRLNNVSAFDQSAKTGDARAANFAESSPDDVSSDPPTARNQAAAHDSKGITPNEAAEAFTRVLSDAISTPQVAISSRRLPELLAASRQLTTEKILEELSKLNASTLKHPRPSVQTTYVAPRTGLEQQLVDIWREMLRLEEVGIHDNLFEIGGDSLMATQLISRISDAFDVELSLRTLFEAPTIAEMQVLILQKQVEEIDDEAAAQLVAEIEGMSASELEDWLAAEEDSVSDTEANV
ncbi:MAG TPA: SDR family NAD(P)-dependent oxidoreductase [Pyrinomonadaceae bacterium]|jgi:acyl transferase domain-containing protein